MLQDYEGAKAVLERPQRAPPPPQTQLDRELGIDAEQDNTVTARVDRLVRMTIPGDVQKVLGTKMIELPLAMFRPGYEMPPIKPPGDKTATPIEITERESTFEGVLAQKQTAIADGIDTNKSYFMGIARAFGKEVRKMTTVDRDEMPPLLRAQLITFERTILRMAEQGNVLCRFIKNTLLGIIVNLGDGNHRY